MSLKLSQHALYSASLRHLRVITALLLRDMKTRAGSSYFGFFVGLLVPLAHVGIVLGLYVILGRRSALGTDVFLFLSSAIVHFVVWSYTHQKVLFAFPQNIPLVAFPVVKLVDIFIARSVIELMNSLLIILVVGLFLNTITNDFYIHNYPSLFYSFFLSYLLGVSTGGLFGIIAMAVPGFMMVSFLIIPLYWVTCGAFFVPDSLPEAARSALYVLPLTHIVDYGRVAIYPSYTSDYYSLDYVYFVIVLNVLLIFTMMRVMRTLIARH